MDVDVVVHAHYEPELERITHFLNRKFGKSFYNLNCYFGLTEGISLATFEHLQSQDWITRVYRVESRGRNFATLLDHALSEGKKAEYTLHLHTKKSDHLPWPIGRIWLVILLSRLIGKTLELVNTTSKVELENGIYYPRLDFLFRHNSKILFEFSDLFQNPRALENMCLGQVVMFPIGGMFLAQTDKLVQWAKSVNKAKPIFEKHSDIHGKAEHFLERHIGFYFSQH